MAHCNSACLWSLSQTPIIYLIESSSRELLDFSMASSFFREYTKLAYHSLIEGVEKSICRDKSHNTDARRHVHGTRSREIGDA